MKIDRNEADAILADIALVSRRVKQSSIYRGSSLAMVFWGVVIMVGNLAGFFDARWAAYSWLALDLLGIVGTITILARTSRKGMFPSRIVAALGLLIGYGFVWSTLLGRFGPRELDAFWPSLFLCGYALSGFWLGRTFILLGVVLTGLVITGYFWTGNEFDLYLAAVNGGGLILCGLWMRRA